MNDDLFKRTLKTVAWLVGVQLATMAFVLTVFFIASRATPTTPATPIPTGPSAVSPLL